MVFCPFCPQSKLALIYEKQNQPDHCRYDRADGKDDGGDRKSRADLNEHVPSLVPEGCKDHLHRRQNQRQDCEDEHQGGNVVLDALGSLPELFLVGPWQVRL